jgi:hypothetical protein
MTFPATVATGVSRLRRAGRQAVPVVALFLTIVVGRAVFVSLFAESIPFADQWDAEGINLLKPWLEGSLGWADLVAPHNEHRIFFTRLLSLALFEANQGQWDNLVVAYANTMVYAAASTLLYLTLRPGLESHLARAALSLGLIALAWIPYAYENTLVGFQNQFYLMTAFATAAVVIAARVEDSPRLVPLTVIAVTLCYLTMASGLLAGIAAAGVLLLRWWTGRIRVSRAIIGVGILMLCAILFFFAIPRIENHASLKAPDVIAWLRVTVTNLSWPLSQGYRTAWIVWLPAATAAVRLYLTRRATADELVAFGLAAWVVMQAMAIGYSRGNGMFWPSSRYTDTLALGLVVNLWFALRILAAARAASPSLRSPRFAGALLMLTVLTLGAGHAFIARLPQDIAAAQAWHDASLTQTKNVRAYVLSGDISALRQPLWQIPYPDAGRLGFLLNDRTLRSIFPASIRESLSGVFIGKGSGFLLEQPDVISPLLSSCLAPDCVSAQGRWISSTLPGTLPYLQIQASVRGSTQGIAVSTASPSGLTLSHAAGVSLAGSRFTRLHLRTGDAPFHLSAVDHSRQGSLALRGAAEVGMLSMLSAELQDRVRHRFGREAAVEREVQVFIRSPSADPVACQVLQLDNGDSSHAAWQAPRSERIERALVQTSGLSRPVILWMYPVHIGLTASTRHAVQSDQCPPLRLTHARL